MLGAVKVRPGLPLLGLSGTQACGCRLQQHPSARLLALPRFPAHAPPTAAVRPVAQRPAVARPPVVPLPASLRSMTFTGRYGRRSSSPGGPTSRSPRPTVGSTCSCTLRGSWRAASPASSPPSGAASCGCEGRRWGQGGGQQRPSCSQRGLNSCWRRSRASCPEERALQADAAKVRLAAQPHRPAEAEAPCLILSPNICPQGPPRAQVCAGPALTLFTPAELELLICGLPHLDFEALQGAAKYEGGYTRLVYGARGRMCGLDWGQGGAAAALMCPWLWPSSCCS